MDIQYITKLTYIQDFHHAALRKQFFKSSNAIEGQIRIIAVFYFLQYKVLSIDYGVSGDSTLQLLIPPVFIMIKEEYLNKFIDYLLTAKALQICLSFAS